MDLKTFVDEIDWSKLKRRSKEYKDAVNKVKTFIAGETKKTREIVDKVYRRTCTKCGKVSDGYEDVRIRKTKDGNKVVCQDCADKEKFDKA